MRQLKQEGQLRLDVLLRSAGAASRRQTRLAAAQGRITVNDVTVSDPALLCRAGDKVCLDGVLVTAGTAPVWMLHKPAGVICATESATQTTVLDLMPDEPKGLFPVGRLDKDAGGLLLITADGELCRRVLRPESRVVKTYAITVSGAFPPDAGERFLAGLTLENGTVCRPALLHPDPDGRGGLVRVCEGRRHQVKRMAAALGVRVTSLRRTAIGCLTLDPALEPGAYRELTTAEIALLFQPPAVWAAAFPTPTATPENSAQGQLSGGSSRKSSASPVTGW